LTRDATGNVLHLQLLPMLRMRGARPSPPQYVIMAWCLVKYRESFVLHFTVTHDDQSHV